MDRKVLIAIILSAVVLFSYPYIVQRFTPKPAPKKTVQTPSAPAGEAPAGPSAQAPKAPAARAEVKEELITVETPLVKAVFTNIGAGVKGWELKKYSEKLGEKAPVVDLARTVSRERSFKTQLSSNGFVEDIAFSPSRTALTLSEGETGEIVFSATASNGLTIEKKLVFSGSSYIVNTELRVYNTAQNAFNGRMETTLSSDSAGKDKSGYHSGPIVLTPEKLARPTEKEPQNTGTGSVKWLGLETKYFLSAIVPKSDMAISWTTLVPSAVSAKAALQVPLGLAPGARAAYAYDMYLGPKEYDRLLKEKTGLEEAIEFGYFGFMAKPFLVVLNFFQRYLGNYGLAIVILTVIVKVIFYPLTKHSLKSMKQMQNIQPQLAAIKEKYKDNKEKLNKEMMELYKRYKINPLGGCLPMLLQIPVFIALYEVLYVAIELRHAPLFLWIRDLSDKDPYYVTPLIMGATMFIQQKMTPSTPDPTQAKIMLIMPVVFTFMFLNFPSGLVLYWLVNNVLSIAQQYYIQKAPAPAKA